MAYNLPGFNMLGIFGFLIDWLTKIFGSLISVFFEILLALFSRLFYTIASQLLGIVDFIQGMFRQLAGLAPYWYGGVQTGTENGPATQDPILSFITNPDVLRVLLGMTIIAIAMLLIVTVVQVIRIEYTTEGSKNSKGGVIGQALKALAMFAIVPVGIGLSLTASNLLLRSIDAATGGEAGGSTIAGAVFTASAHEANYVRRFGEAETPGDDFFKDVIDRFSGMSAAIKVSKDGTNGSIYITEGANNAGKFTVSGYSSDQEAVEALAKIIDEAFAKKEINNNSSNLYKTPTFDYANPYSVSMYYSLRSVNYLVLYAAAIMIIYVLFQAMFGMVMRIYKALVLFMIVPPIVALTPLDNGSAFKQWRTEFIKTVLSAYGTIVGLNLFIILINIVGDITLFPPNNNNFFNYSLHNSYVNLIFVVVGCYMLKELIGMVSKLIGADDAFSAGSGMSKKAVGTAAKIATGVATGGASLMMPSTYANAGKSMASRIGSAKDSAKASMTGFANDNLLFGGVSKRQRQMKRNQKDFDKKWGDVVGEGENADPNKLRAAAELANKQSILQGEIDTKIGKHEGLKASSASKLRAARDISPNVLGKFVGDDNVKKGISTGLQLAGYDTAGAKAKKDKEKAKSEKKLAEDAQKAQIEQAEIAKEGKIINNLQQQYSTPVVENKAVATQGLFERSINAISTNDTEAFAGLEESLEQLSSIMDGGFEDVKDEIIKLINETKNSGKSAFAGDNGQALKDRITAQMGDYINDYKINATIINDAISKDNINGLSEKLLAEFRRIGENNGIKKEQLDKLFKIVEKQKKE